MAVLKTSCPSYTNNILLKLMSEKLTHQHRHDVVQLISSGESEYIHEALLKNVSVFLSDIAKLSPSFKSSLA